MKKYDPIKAVVLQGILNVKKDVNGVLTGIAVRKDGATSIRYLLDIILANNGEDVTITFERHKREAQEEEDNE